MGTDVAGCTATLRSNPAFDLHLWAWACGVVNRAPVCHLGDPGSNLGQAEFLLWLMARTLLHSMHRAKTGRGDASQIRVNSLICYKKPIVLFENTTMHLWIQRSLQRKEKNNREKIEGQRGGKAQGSQKDLCFTHTITMRIKIKWTLLLGMSERIHVALQI
jgi:hypothetical protein